MGSSPLTRGKPPDEISGGVGDGLIPAHAGKTRRARFHRLHTRAHPRSRGENHGEHFGGGLIEGSSPLTRGKRCEACGLGADAGLIPAHARKTWRSPAKTCKPRAHPRSRGENSRQRPGKHRTRGSSPLTRGKLTRSSVGTAPCGLIPAHAGKTRRGRHSDETQRAHPRSRGENPRRAVALTRNRGSSPLTRGKRTGPAGCFRALRLIPAHAGKTTSRSRDLSSRTAHPRSRGEN